MGGGVGPGVLAADLVLVSPLSTHLAQELGKFEISTC